MKSENLGFGHEGELAAAERASQKGYEVLGMNYRVVGGEIDLILKSPDGVIVFAEVKSRANVRYGYPEDAVTPAKKEHILRAAYQYLDENFPDEDVPWRIDIMALIYDRDKTEIKDFRWYENVTADD